MPLLSSTVNGFWKRDLHKQGEKLCISALEQARMPFFYESWGVPDTLEGRYDLACLHIALVLRHLRGTLAQSVFNSFFSYTELTLREIGVSDLRVGKQVKSCAKYFYGAMKAYNDSFDHKQNLREALLRNVFGSEESRCLLKLEAYVRSCDSLLKEQDLEKQNHILWSKIEEKEN